MDKPEVDIKYPLIITAVKQHQQATNNFKRWFTVDEVDIQARVLSESLPLVNQGDFTESDLTLADRSAQVQQCGMRTMARLYPMADGEVVEAEFFTALSSSFQHFDENTLVLIRRSNVMDVAIVFNFARVSGGELSFVERPQMASPLMPERPDALVISSTLSAVAISVAKTVVLAVISTIVSKMVGKVLDKAINKVFPADLPAYFDEVYTEVRSIVREELDQHTLDDIKGKLVQMSRNIRQEYLPRKNKIGFSTEKSKQRLSAILKSYSDEFWKDIMARLMSDRYSGAGLGLFCDAANLHMLILLERALVDDFADNYQDSSFIITMRKVAADYIKHLDSHIDKLRAERLPKLYKYNRSEHVDMGAWSGVFNVFYFRDDHADHEYRLVGNVKSGCKEEEDEHEQVRDNAYESYRKHTFEAKLNSELEVFTSCRESLHSIREALRAPKHLLAENWKGRDFSVFGDQLVWVDEGRLKLGQLKRSEWSVKELRILDEDWQGSQLILQGERLFWREGKSTLKMGRITDLGVSEVCTLADDWITEITAANERYIFWAEYGRYLYRGEIIDNRIHPERIHEGMDACCIAVSDDDFIWDAKDKYLRKGTFTDSSIRFSNRIVSAYHSHNFELSGSDLIFFDENENELYLVEGNLDQEWEP